MIVGLHGSDGGSFPNLALMKLSAWHKSRGDSVEMFNPLGLYDKIYSSKVFTFTKCDPYLPDYAIKGGTGYSLNNCLPDEIEHIAPDYDFFNVDFSMGFLTRGCPRKCSWCFVPSKEGDIRAHADIEEFARHSEVVLMDNNVLSHGHGIEQIEKMARLGMKVDFNQGLDARLIDDSIARRLSKLKWLKPIRMACDHSSQIGDIRKAVELLRWHNATPSRFFCYVLVKDIPDALERVRFLKSMYVDPFAQPYINERGDDPPTELKRFARWVNHKAIFKTTTWEEYSGN